MKWRGSLPTKVQLTVYVDPKVKRGMKVLGGILNQTTSKMVEELCINFLEKWPEVGEIIEKKE